MPVKVTSLNDAILAVVSALQGAGLGYPVFDGPPNQRPARETNRYVCIGLEDLPGEDKEAGTATMDQVWSGLGQRARMENLNIECVAIGKATSAASARALAISVIQDVSNNLALHPTAETYNALVSAVTAARVRDTAGGTVSIIQFTISAQARLI